MPRDEKHYTVFLARLTPKAKAAWRPQLNEEHSAWRWMPLAAADAANTPLHPVVKKLLKPGQSRQTVLTAMGGSG